MLDATRRAGVDHLILASSSSVYGANPTLPKHESMAHDFFKMGVENTFALSAEHGIGIEAMLEELVKGFPEAEQEPTGVQGESALQ